MAQVFSFFSHQPAQRGTPVDEKEGGSVGPDDGEFVGAAVEVGDTDGFTDGMNVVSTTGLVVGDVLGGTGDGEAVVGGGIGSNNSVQHPQPVVWNPQYVPSTHMRPPSVSQKEISVRHSPFHEVLQPASKAAQVCPCEKTKSAP